VGEGVNIKLISGKGCFRRRHGGKGSDLAIVMVRRRAVEGRDHKIVSPIRRMR